MLNKKIAGTVTLFHPDNEVEKNIETYIGDLDILYIADNTPNQMTELAKKLSKNPKVKIIHHGENQGISYPLNLAAKKAKAEGVHWLLSMDQDSFFEKGEFDKLSSGRALFPDAVVLAPTYDTGLYTVIPFEGWEEVAEVFTSGNLIQLDKLHQVGYFDEDLFIDYVDNEFCLRVKKKGFKIFQCKNSILHHNLGQPTRVKLLHKSLTTTNHSPIRYYYRTRNRMYCWLRYPSFILGDLNRMWKEMVLVFLFEKERPKKFKWIILGIFHFLIGKKGKVI